MRPAYEAKSAPMADGHILGRADDMALLRRRRIPRDAIPVREVSSTDHREATSADSPLLAVPSQRDIRQAAIIRRMQRVFRTIEDVHFAHDRLRSDEIRVLRHVPSSIDFAVVIDRLNDADSRRAIIVSSNLCAPTCSYG